MRKLNISVVIPRYNRSDLIARALRFVLRQIDQEDEILVIDDGSSGNTRQSVEAFRDERIRYFWQANTGACSARNRGAREATGDLIAFLDSDDEWLPGKIELQRRFMTARPDVLFCCTDFAGESGEWRQRHYTRNWHTDARSWEEIMGPPLKYSSLAELPRGDADFNVYAGDIYRGEMRTNYIPTSTIVIRRREAGDAIHFKEGAKTFEDWECWGRLARRGRAAYLDCETAVQHKHRGSRLTNANWLTRAESRLVVLKNVWGSDSAFLEKYRDEYQAVVHEQQVARVHGLLALGRTREAREQIRYLSGVPITYHALAMLPGIVVNYMVAIRRARTTRLERAAAIRERLEA